MIGKEPKFISSPFLVMEPGNWHLKPGAPQEIIDEFNEYIRTNGNNGYEDLPED